MKVPLTILNVVGTNKTEEALEPEKQEEEEEGVKKELSEEEEKRKPSSEEEDEKREPSGEEEDEKREPSGEEEEEKREPSGEEEKMEPSGDIFVHQSVIEGAGWRSLAQGQHVILTCRSVCDRWDRLTCHLHLQVRL